MAGVVYMKSNSSVSLTGAEYTNLSIPSGAKTLYVQTGSATSDRVKYGLTTDPTATSYSPVINVSGSTMYIAKQYTTTNGQSTRTATSEVFCGYEIKGNTVTGTFKSYSIDAYSYDPSFYSGMTYLHNRTTFASGISHATLFDLAVKQTYTTSSWDEVDYAATKYSTSGTATQSNRLLPNINAITSYGTQITYALSNVVSLSSTSLKGYAIGIHFTPHYAVILNNNNTSYTTRLWLFLYNYNYYVPNSSIGSTYTYANSFTTSAKKKITSESTYTSNYDVTITTNNIYTGN